MVMVVLVLSIVGQSRDRSPVLGTAELVGEVVEEVLPVVAVLSEVLAGWLVEDALPFVDDGVPDVVPLGSDVEVLFKIDNGQPNPHPVPRFLLHLRCVRIILACERAADSTPYSSNDHSQCYYGYDDPKMSPRDSAYPTSLFWLRTCRLVGGLHILHITLRLFLWRRIRINRIEGLLMSPIDFRIIGAVHLQSRLITLHRVRLCCDDATCSMYTTGGSIL